MKGSNTRARIDVHLTREASGIEDGGFEDVKKKDENVRRRSVKGSRLGNRMTSECAGAFRIALAVAKRSARSRCVISHVRERTAFHEGIMEYFQIALAVKNFLQKVQSRPPQVGETMASNAR
jgi:hypothetical protein